MADRAAFDAYRQAWDRLTAPGQSFAVSEQAIRGVTMRVFDTAPPNMRAVWESSTKFSDKPYLVYEDETLTYNHAHAAVRSFAHTLVERYGIQPGDRVAIAMRNYPEWVLAYWATLSVGAAVVGVNAWWTTPELEYGLSDSKPRVIIADQERLERLAPILESLRATAPLDVIAVRPESECPEDFALWTEVANPADAPDELPPAEIDPDAEACIFYTSGTTGFPKGAQMTHRSCVTNVMNCLFSGAVRAATAAIMNPPDPSVEAATAPPTAFMAPTPLFHVTANNCVMHPATITGAKLVLMRKWNAGRALELIEREGVTSVAAVPTMNRELVMHADFATRDTSTLSGMSGGGAAVQPDLVHKIKNAPGPAKPSTGYGLTETGLVAGVGDIFFEARPTSVGPVLPALEAKIIDEDGNEVAQGDAGELCLKGGSVIMGYLNRPEATAEAIVEGWFHSGDVAMIDENGFIHIVDRIKDLVIRGGENISCSEVEAAIYEHPSVAEASVFSVPDDRLGEAVGVALHLASGASLSEEELRTHLEPRLAAFKIPEHVWVRDEPLPQNASGKFLKRTLQEELAGTTES